MFNKLLSYAPVQIFSALSVFALIAIQTRFLTVSEYGLLAVLLVIMESTRSMFAQWINTALLRFYPSAQSPEREQLLCLSSSLLWLFAAVAVLVVALCLWVFSLFSWSNMLWVALLFVAKGTYTYYLERARVCEQVNRYRYATLTQAVLSVVLTLGCLWLDGALHSALIALVASNAIALLFTLRRNPQGHKGTPVLRREFLHYGLPFMFTGALGVLATRSDRIVIAQLTSLEQAGLYAGIANLLVGLMALVFMVVALPLYPELTKLTDKPQQLRQAHSRYGGYLCALAIPALTGLCLLAQPLITVFLGERYQQLDLRVFYAIAAATFILNLRGHYLDHGLQFRLRTQWLPLITAVGFALQLALAFTWVPKLGALGAALALLIAMCVAALLSLITGRYYRYHFTWPAQLYKTLLATTVMGAVLYTLLSTLVSLAPWQQLVIGVLVGITTYALMHWLLNTFAIRSQSLNWRRRSV
ncbi:lipopolysaccharide biosynthesis protein [Pseudoalteromonas ruthenica]|uniref:lipopolysaccharide biosynthesis protein n=1 Tax=Pseudoalteromonas ruthenica TaxID=151081 RepID=UPI00034DBCEE|nr:lipopolysaccharide biosynthesis protein [Pseudoalteromonas ruthenica]